MFNVSLDQIIDREKIRDCLYLYCRGIDRADEQALRRCYWPDAYDNHGPYKGNAEGFIEWAMASLQTFKRSIHQINNILFEFQGTSASVESYFTAYQVCELGGKSQQLFIMGRYLDRFEKRSEEWRIARRLVVYDWLEEQASLDKSEVEHFGLRQPIGQIWPDDMIYRLAAVDEMSRA